MARESECPGHINYKHTHQAPVVCYVETHSKGIFALHTHRKGKSLDLRGRLLSFSKAVFL
ncbi:UNVERIFIED_CONTAM: hypothetical protein FKN15_063779 [Acipenser sinensis]